MEDPHFIKCEPEWQSETENSSNLERNVRLPSDKLVQVKVEPDLLFPGRSLEQEDGKVFKEECGIQEVKSEESSTSGAGTNNIMPQENILRWLEEEVDDEPIGGVNSDSDGQSEHEDLDTETEQSDNSDSESRISTTNREVYIGKDGSTEWYKHKPPPTKTARQNIVTQLPAVKGAAKNLKTIVDCWKLYFQDTMIARIVEYTNQELGRMASSYSRNERDCPHTDFEEISAFLGVLYLAGVKKSQHLNTEELWAMDGTVPDFFIASMSKRRFHTLMQAIRFDDMNTRAQRKQADNLAPVREIFDEFVEVCSNSYSPSAYTTLDDMLDAFRGTCKFGVYVPNKLTRYGIKIYALCDARSFYTMNLEVYAGKQPCGPYNFPNDARSVVLRMIKPIENTGRNVTMDSYLTSVPIANELYTNHQITLVGTLRRFKKEVPAEFLSVKERAVNSSMFAFGRKPTNNCLLISYVPEKGKNLLILSTMHDDDAIDPDSGEASRPEGLTFYNLTKEAVKVVDSLKSEYSVSRISGRWPLTLFFSLMNIGAVNAQIVYHANTSDLLPRRKFLTQLSLMLVRPHLIRRLSVPNLSLRLKEKIKNVAGVDKLPINREEPRPTEKTKCVYCPKRKNRFTQTRCTACSMPICREHTARTVLICCECNLHGVRTASDD